MSSALYTIVWVPSILDKPKSISVASNQEFWLNQNPSPKTLPVQPTNFLWWKAYIMKESFNYILYTLLLLLLLSRPTLCHPVDGSPPGSPIPGILQARTLEWVAISFCNAWKWKVKVKSLRRVWLLAIPWTAAYQAPPSVGFSRQEYWSGVPLPSPQEGSELQKKKKYLNKPAFS